MISIRKIVIIIFFILSVVETTLANEKTAFINVDHIIKNSNIGKKVLKKINEQNKKNINELEKKNKDLKDLELEIKSKKNIISEAEFNNEVLSFQKKIENFSKEKSVLAKEFNDFRKKEFEKILILFNPIISNYMQENSINIILDSKNIFMGNDNLNLTDDILKIINNEIK